MRATHIRPCAALLILQIKDYAHIFGMNDVCCTVIQEHAQYCASLRLIACVREFGVALIVIALSKPMGCDSCKTLPDPTAKGNGGHGYHAASSE